MVARLTRLLLLVGLFACMAGCSSLRPWLNEPLRGEKQEWRYTASDRDPTILVAVTLSGGGARASAFGFGVLMELQRTAFEWHGRKTNLLESVDVISGVSGGSILAAYYAAFGAHDLPKFEAEFLRKNFQNNLILQALRPTSLYDLTSPWYGRSHLLARRLDELYAGKTYGDLERDARAPRLVVSATDMSLGTPFEFTPTQFGLICSDLRSVPLSFAVASSSAVPVLLSPTTLKNFALDCQQRGVVTTPSAQADDPYRVRLFLARANSYLDAGRRPYIHLVDGGLADNLGIVGLLDRTLAGGGLESFHDAGLPQGVVQKMVLITVNSARDPSNNVDASDRVPGMRAVADTMLFGAGARATTETQAFLADSVRQWREDLRTRSSKGNDPFAPDAQIHVIPVNLRDAADEDQRQGLLQIPTAFSISDVEVSRLIEAGRSALHRSAEFQELLRSLGAAGVP